MNASFLLFLNIGAPETIVIVLAILLLFGGKKLPELARGLGKGIREFKDASDDVKREIHRNINSVNEELNVSSYIDDYPVNTVSHNAPDLVNTDLNTTAETSNNLKGASKVKSPRKPRAKKPTTN